jgi:myo-inositol-1(or 4)-monophosphatase
MTTHLTASSPDPFEPSSELAAMIAGAEAAGAGLLHRFRHRADLVVELKGPADFVSLADREAEATLRDHLIGAYPRYGFLAEEGTDSIGADAGTRFIVDPLDGTTNFLCGIPHFSVSIALERAGRIVFGVVYDVPLGEMFVAEAGRGAWLATKTEDGAWRGSERLAVSEDADFSRALVGTGIPHASRRERHAAFLPVLAAVMRDSAGVRRMASAALDLAYVAAGRFAAYWELGLSPWDIAAGTLLVREAGGRISEAGREESSESDDRVVYAGDVLATNGRLHARMTALLREARPFA